MKQVSEMGRSNMGWKALASGKPDWKRKKLVSALLPVLGLAILPGIVACDNDYSLGWAYVTSASTTSGLINTYGVDDEAGYLRTLADSPVPSGGRKPNVMVADPLNHQFMYVANHDDSTIVLVGIGTDGKLYPDVTYNTTGSFPTGAAISPDGLFLYVTYTYQSCLTTNVEQAGGTNPNCVAPLGGFSAASPGPGGISIYAINRTNNTLGTPTDFPIGRSPMGIAVGANHVVYVIAQDTAALSTTAPGQTANLFAFQQNTTSGALTALPGSTINPTAGNVISTGYPSGVLPGGLILDATAAHLYVSDFAGNALYGYSIGPNGVPTQLGSALADAGPEGMAIDPTGQFLYVADYTAGTIGGYTFGSNGAPVRSTVAQSTQAGEGTSCVAIEPLHGQYLYTSNALSNSVTGEQILSDGSLKPIINQPYTASTLPVCIITVQRVF